MIRGASGADIPKGEQKIKAGSTALFAGAIGCALVRTVPAAEAATYTEKVLYSFCSQQKCTDGSVPYAGVINVGGMLYGTTADGGVGGCTGGCGTVFSLDPSTGTETVLYSFAGGTDGEFPRAGLTDVKGMLYGTTSWGGNSNSACYTEGCGTVFSFDLKTGKETVVYSFCSQENCADGQTPEAGLIDVEGVLYGTTGLGGVNGAAEHGGALECTGSNCGTAFSLDLGTGAETVLHSFAGGTDGAYPDGSLIDVKGTLYGTTETGGTITGGTVFSIDLGSGAETVLYSFCSRSNCSDGQFPLAGLIDVRGTLYGTTEVGGTGCGCGTVFSVTTSGVENVVHSFQGGNDGEYPEAGLLKVGGTLYGTTNGGGVNEFGGTVFAIRLKTGNEKAAYSFQGTPDGALPTAGLINVSGTLYCTTAGGGNGYGTVFALTKTR
jgi:uncharacterized repeat protein (TIGR03803 family)